LPGREGRNQDFEWERPKYILKGLGNKGDYDHSFFGGDQLYFYFFKTLIIIYLMKWEGTMALASPLLVPSLLGIFFFF
jgi:hypothetical protein